MTEVQIVFIRQPPIEKQISELILLGCFIFVHVLYIPLINYSFSGFMDFREPFQADIYSAVMYERYPENELERVSWKERV